MFSVTSDVLLHLRAGVVDPLVFQLISSVVFAAILIALVQLHSLLKASLKPSALRELLREAGPKEADLEDKGTKAESPTDDDRNAEG